MKIVVNPTYEHLRKFIESVPDTFEREGRIIYSGRNLIKVMENRRFLFSDGVVVQQV